MKRSRRFADNFGICIWLASCFSILVWLMAIPSLSTNGYQYKTISAAFPFWVQLPHLQLSQVELSHVQVVAPDVVPPPPPPPPPQALSTTKRPLTKRSLARDETMSLRL